MEDQWLSHLCDPSGSRTASPKLAASVETLCKIIPRPYFEWALCHLCGHPPHFVPGGRLPTSLGSDQDSRDSCNACNNNRERIEDGGDGGSGSLFLKSLPWDVNVILLEADSFTCCRGRSVFETQRAEFHSRDSQQNWSDTAHSLVLLIADLFRWHRCLSENICSSSGWKHIRGRFCLCTLEETLISLS